MFCPKCGMKSIDGGVFCQKCGARLVIDEARQSDSAAALSRQEYIKVPNNTVNVPKKGKKGKILILLGMVVLAVLAIVIASGMSEEVDYVAAVKGSKPLEETQGLEITCGDVFEQYMNKPDWEVRESGDIHYVDINGVVKDTGYDLAVTFKVSPDPDDDSMLLIEPESVVYNGEKLSTKDDAADFLVSLFSAYNEDKVLSDMKSEETAPSDTSATEKTELDAGDTADQLLYNGIPVDTIMEMKAEDIIAAFGEPDEYSTEYFVQIPSKDGESLVAMANFDDAGYVSYFAGGPENYEINGQNLNHDYDKLVEIFGREPDSQETYDLLEAKWFYDGYSILIGLDSDGLPGKAEVWKEDEMNDGANEQNQVGFNRSDYFTTIPINDMLRNPDSYYNSHVFYDHFTVKELTEPRLYIAKDESPLQNYSGKYIVIDDRNHEGVNAIVGDQVTVYGRFTGTTTINFMDGSSQQCVVITADRFIDNAEMVTDMQDFAQAIVANMNQPVYDEQSEYLFGTGSRYISDTSVQLILGVRCTNIEEPDISWITPRKDGDFWLAGSVDGYSVCIDAEYAPDLVMPWDAGIEVDYGGTVAMRVNGKIKSVEPYMGSSYALEVTLYVESFEPY